MVYSFKWKTDRKGGLAVSYTTIKDRIQAVPEEYLDEVADYIDYVLYKVSRRKADITNDTSRFFGCLAKPVDGLEIQRSLRNEWD